MSLSVLRLVWELPWPTEAKILAAWMAYIVNDQGLRVFATVETLAGKASLSERSVQRCLAVFRRVGLLIEIQKATRRTPTHYQVDVARLRGWLEHPETCPAWPSSPRDRSRQGRPAVTSDAAVDTMQGCPSDTPADAQGRPGDTSRGCQADTSAEDVGCQAVPGGVPPATSEGCQADTQIRELRTREQIRKKDPEKTLQPCPGSDSAADLPDTGHELNAQGPEEDSPDRDLSEPVSAAELQQRFIDHRTPDGRSLRDPEGEWRRCRAYWLKRAGAGVNWHILVDGWLRNIDDGYAQAGEDRRGPHRADRPVTELTSVGDILAAALSRAQAGGGG